MFINYRHYTTKAIIDILTRESVYFSRGSFVDRGRFRKPDVVSLRVVEHTGKSSSTIVIECEVFNNLESYEDLLQQTGFVWDEYDGKHCKLRTIIFHPKMEADELVNSVTAGLDEAMQDMPLLTYAAPVQKALADYHGFMNADIAKISYGDLMQYLGYWKECDFSGKAANADAEDPAFMIAKYKKGRWAAWASGDLIVPLFSSEIEAIQFLRNRIMRVCRQRPAIRTILPANRGYPPNLYVLVDQTRNLNERVAWLREEIDRLESQGEVVCS